MAMENILPCYQNVVLFRPIFKKGDKNGTL